MYNLIICIRHLRATDGTHETKRVNHGDIFPFSSNAANNIAYDIKLKMKNERKCDESSDECQVNAARDGFVGHVVLARPVGTLTVPGMQDVRFLVGFRVLSMVDRQI